MNPQLAARILDVMDKEELTYYEAMDTLCWIGARVKEQREKRADDMAFSPIARDVRSRARALFHTPSEDG